MIFFEKITYKELKPLVELGFGDDPELMETYQQIKTPFAVTVQRNLDNIKNAQGYFDLTYFRVKWGKNIIGFTVIDKKEKLLYSFGINIKYRKKEIVLAWYKNVCELMDYYFACILWNQNFRAIQFLKRQGMNVIAVNDETCTLVLT